MQPRPAGLLIDSYTSIPDSTLRVRRNRTFRVGTFSLGYGMPVQCLHEHVQSTLCSARDVCKRSHSCIYRGTRAHIGEEDQTRGKGWAIAVGARPGPAAPRAAGPCGAVAAGSRGCRGCGAAAGASCRKAGQGPRYSVTAMLIHVTSHVLVIPLSIHESKRRDATHTHVHTPTAHTLSPGHRADRAGPHRTHVHTPW